MPDLRYVMFTPPRAASKVIHLEYEGDDVLRLEVDPRSAGFFRSGVDLVVRESGGDIVFIDGFFHSAQGLLPGFKLPDGSLLSAREFFAAYAPDLEPVASISAGVGPLGDYPGMGAGLSVLKGDGESGRVVPAESGELMKASDGLQQPTNGQAVEGADESSFRSAPDPLAFDDSEARIGILLTPDERAFLCRPPVRNEFSGMNFQNLGDCSQELLDCLFTVEPLNMDALFHSSQQLTAGGLTSGIDLLTTNHDGVDLHSLLSSEEYLLLLGQV